MHNFPTSITVTDQVIDISMLSETQKAYYENLAKKIIEKYSSLHQDRILMTLSGPSGTGKSVIAEILRLLISEMKPDFSFYAAGLDAFHYPNSYLEKTKDAHSVFLKSVKGRYDTYDTKLLLEKLSSFKKGEIVTFPKYSRELHEPVQDSLKISEQKALLFIEGLWFLRNDEVWEAVRKHSSYNFSITANEDVIKSNTIKRHIAGSRSPLEAKLFYEKSDHENFEEIMRHRVKEDEVLEYFEKV
jgi:pantothenate kinase